MLQEVKQRDVTTVFPWSHPYFTLETLGTWLWTLGASLDQTCEPSHLSATSRKAGGPFFNSVITLRTDAMMLCNTIDPSSITMFDPISQPFHPFVTLIECPGL